MRRWRSISAMAAAVAISAVVPVSGQTIVGYEQTGMPMRFTDFVEIGNAALLGRLVDPDSAKIEWPYLPVGGYLKGLLAAKQWGFWTCGFVNARNRMGGYTGSSPFLIMIKDKHLVSLDIGTDSGIDVASVTCAKASKNGLLKPAPPLAPSVPTAAAAPSIPPPPPGPSIGIAFAPVPDGAYIASVVPGGAAARAGIVAGMVASSVNGVALKGFDAATLAKVMQGASSPVTLSIIGRGDVRIVKQ